MLTPLLEAADWKMRVARPLYVHTEMPVGEVYVHQTAGRDPVDTFPSGDDHPADAFWALNEWAINGKGYSAIDYSIMVHTGPSLRTTVGVARGEFVPAATKDRNRQSKAVCLLGWFGPPDPEYKWTYDSSRAPFDSELWAVAESIVLMIQRGWVRPDAKILGHRDNPAHPGATGCPGDYLQAALPTVRQYVNTLLNPPEIPVDIVTKAQAKTALFQLMAYCAANPGNNSQGVLWDVLLPHICSIRIAADDPRRREFELAARSGNGDRLLRAWAPILASMP